MAYRNFEIVKKNSIYVKNRVYYLNEPDPKSIEAESLYLKVRARECRIYTDDEVKILPSIDKSHRYFNEWKIRSLMAGKLCSIIFNELSTKSILEVGCGNGWLSAMLANDASSAVIGLDINRTELEQGAKIFNDKNNLMFVYGNINGNSISELRFDYIILASSASYFDDLESEINQLLNILNEQGEIHIIDNPSYCERDIEPAKKRSEDYFTNLGFPEMGRYYYHHNLLEICKKYNHKVLYNPENILNRAKMNLAGTGSPFYWISIQK